MKKYLILFLILTFFSCKEESVPEPEIDLGQEKFTEILYDIAILQSANVISPDELKENDIVLNEYIYGKYGIDSTIFNQNQRYYASDVKVYRKIYDKVVARIESEKAIIDSLLSKKKE